MIDHPRDILFALDQMASQPLEGLEGVVGRGHTMVIGLEQTKRINHFATAFFRTYLQNKSKYRDYFSEDFLAVRSPGLGGGIQARDVCAPPEMTKEKSA